MKLLALFYLVSVSWVFSNSCRPNNKQSKVLDDILIIPQTTLSSSDIRDLAILGKVWGFLKYYHPAIGKGHFDWDENLLRIYPQILNAKTSEQRQDFLIKWVDQLGKTETMPVGNRIDTVVKSTPDITWITPEILGATLANKLLEIQKAKRGSSHHYVRLVPTIQNPSFENEKTYSGTPFPTTAVRLLALYRYWNIIEYFFPYKGLMDENWGTVLEKFIPQFISAENELQYKLVLLSLIAHVQDGHANIWDNGATQQQVFGQNCIPVKVSFVESKAVILDKFHSRSLQKTGLRRGDIIDSVNGRSVEAIIKERLPFTPASNYPTQLRAIARNLLRTNDARLTLVYTRGLTSIKATIDCISSQKSNTSEYPVNDTCFKYITPDISYLYLGSIKSTYLPALMLRIQQTKGLIIDLRCYPSEFVVFSLGAYLMPSPTAFVKFSKGNIQSPGLFTFTEPLFIGKYNSDYYKGKVIILVNETTLSQAEYTTMALRVAPKALVVGSTTAGADGNVSEIFLPGNIRTMISGIGVYYPDGRETQRIGIIPDVEVKPTIKGILENRDEVLERAIELINK